MMAKDLARPDRFKMRGEGLGKRLHNFRPRELVNHRGCQERNPASTLSQENHSQCYVGQLQVLSLTRSTVKQLACFSEFVSEVSEVTTARPSGITSLAHHYASAAHTCFIIHKNHTLLES